MSIPSNLRTFGWAVSQGEDTSELMATISSLYRRQFSIGNTKTEEGVSLIQIIGSCSECDPETIAGVRTCISFWNALSLRRQGLQLRSSTLTGTVKSCRTCD